MKNNGLTKLQNLAKSGHSIFAKFAPKMELANKKFSLVGDHTFFKNTSFKWLAEIENNWEDIVKEMEFVLENSTIPSMHQVSRLSGDLDVDKKWKIYVFYFYSFIHLNNCKRCPKTQALLRKIPGMKTAFFSILEPGKHILPHRGPYNGVLRFHLGLKVPLNKCDCKIKVGNENRFWENGKSLIFDDSYIHEVRNDTDEIRVVLFVDFLRPLPFVISLLNRIFVNWISRSLFIKDVTNNLNNLDNIKNSH